MERFEAEFDIHHWSSKVDSKMVIGPQNCCHSNVVYNCFFFVVDQISDEKTDHEFKELKIPLYQSKTWKIARNKWHLAMTLMRNPSLQKYRRRAGENKKTVNELFKGLQFDTTEMTEVGDKSEKSDDISDKSDQEDNNNVSDVRHPIEV